MRQIGVLLLLLQVAAAPAIAADAAGDPARSLIGVWMAQHDFGPDVHGTLTITRRADRWSAEVAHESVTARVAGQDIAFELPDGRGSFRGHLAADASSIRGFWIQPATPFLGYYGYASPVSLNGGGSTSRWQGELTPLDDRATLYLVVQLGTLGEVTAFLRNPERNLGSQFVSDRLELTDGRFELMRDRVDEPVLRGTFDAERQKLSIDIPTRGNVTYHFVRIDAESEKRFFPRGRHAPPYRYRQPASIADGWRTATLEEVGIASPPIAALMTKLLSNPMGSLRSPDIHAVLIARHGKLVVEEYFHGFGPDTPHDVRSAFKSVTTTLMGASMLSGASIAPSTLVYGFMRSDSATAPEPRKAAISVEHLMTMSSGLDCDDWQRQSAGNEDVMFGQSGQPDWAQFTLDLPMVHAPGEHAAYCGGSINLVGAMLGRANRRPLTEMLDRLIAEPLQMGPYHLNLTPTGDVYGAGGSFFRPRDFAKVVQLMVNGGVWNGRRIVSREWVEQATAARYSMPAKPRPNQYGYGWWIGEFPYEGRTVKYFSAEGNGGQFIYGIPELDLVVAFFGGNYDDRVQNVAQREYMPEYIVPAVRPEPRRSVQPTNR